MFAVIPLQVSGNSQHPVTRRFLDPNYKDGFHDVVQYIAAGRSGELGTLVPEDRLRSFRLWLAGFAALKTCEQTIEGTFGHVACQIVYNLLHILY